MNGRASALQIQRLFNMPGTKTRPSDLVLLCANCHRMAYRKRVPFTLAEIRAAIRR